MQAVILAGGKRTQLYPPAANVPKPMLPLFDRPVMEHSVRLLVKHGITDIIVTVSRAAGGIIEHFGDGSRWEARIRYSVENEPRGTAGGVKLVQDMIEGDFVVVPGDAVTDFDLTAAVDAHRSASAVASLMLYEVEDPTDFGLVGHDEHGMITRFVEKPKASEVFTNTVSTGIYILEPEVLSCIPYAKPYDFARELFPRMLNNQEPVYGFSLPGYWCDVGDGLRYRNCHVDALRGELKLDMPAVRIHEGMWVGEGVDVHPSAQLSSPLYVGPGVRVGRNAVLGECTVIGAETVVDEDAYIARSVIGGGSFVGRNARITDCVVGTGYTVMDSQSIYGPSPVPQEEGRRDATPDRPPAQTLAQLAPDQRQA